jgi:hypothetical protein
MPFAERHQRQIRSPLVSPAVQDEAERPVRWWRVRDRHVDLHEPLEPRALGAEFSARLELADSEPFSLETRAFPLGGQPRLDRTS